MSGPKSYSVTVFDKQLKQIFMLQSEIAELWDTLKIKKINDKSRGVEADCGDFILKNKQQLEVIFNPFGLTDKGTLSQKQFDSFYNRIHKTIEQIHIFRDQLNDEIFGFEKIENAYNQYLQLESYLEKLKEDFQILKSEFCGYIQNNASDNPEPEQLLAQVEITELTIEMPTFDQSFVESPANWKIIFDRKFEDCKKHLNLIARKNRGTTGKLTGKSRVSLTSVNHKPENTGNLLVDPDILIRKIKFALAGFSDEKQAGIFRRGFADLLKNHDKNEMYYYAEFLEEIVESQKQAGFRAILLQLEESVNNVQFYDELKEPVELLKLQITETLKRDRLKTNDLETLKTDFEKLLLDQRLLKQQKFAEQQERNFIKTRLITELQELEYEVMTDMNVVDFEKDNSFLFRTPSQENFVNLRFDQQGQLLYNFLIPENREDLTHEKTRIRLAEMQQTCDEFKKMLRSLKNQGLNINLEKEIEANSRGLIQIPARFAGFKAKPKRRSGTTSPAEKTKYFNL